MIPCLNEEDAIAGVVREVLAQGVDEVIVVDNGSTDATAARAREAGARVVSEPTRGYGRACAAGLRPCVRTPTSCAFSTATAATSRAILADVVGADRARRGGFRDGIAAARASASPAA